MLPLNALVPRFSFAHGTGAEQSDLQILGKIDKISRALKWFSHPISVKNISKWYILCFVLQFA